EAEAQFACFIIGHNIPLEASNHVTISFCRMFPDSKIAQTYASKRSKTTAIICHVLAPEIIEGAITAARSGPFTLCLDAISDTEKKLFLILINYCHTQTREIKVALFDVPVYNTDTTETLFECVNEVFKRFQIPWRNVVALLCDNTSVNVERHNSLKALIEKVLSADLFTLGCTGHLICVLQKQLAQSIDVGDIRMFYYLDKSVKRKHLLKEYLDLVGIKYSKILKHAPTRWLSLGRCTDRFLKMLPALHTFFASEEYSSDCISSAEEIIWSLSNAILNMYFFLLAVYHCISEWNNSIILKNREREREREREIKQHQ
uniref:DUF4371 domain-containing protein n=1 Tax=Latimeria chalumnae TaxID=7897 RepID=H2ZYN8_LATCH